MLTFYLSNIDKKFNFGIFKEMYFCWREIYFLREVFSESLVSDWLLLLAFTRSCRQMLHYHQLAGRSEKQEYTVCNLSIMYNVKCIMYSTSSSVYRYIHCNWAFKAGKSQMYCWRFYKAIFYFFSEKNQVWRLSEADLIIKEKNIFGWIVKHICLYWEMVRTDWDWIIFGCDSVAAQTLSVS